MWVALAVRLVGSWGSSYSIDFAPCCNALVPLELELELELELGLGLAPPG